jgi:sodium-dependent dicarboxylate transporter 2/3/5
MQRLYRGAKVIILAGGILLFILSLVMPPFKGLSREGMRSMGLFFLIGSLWMTSPIPPSVTGFLVLGLIPLLNILSPVRTFSLFGNRAVFFILGAFILAAGLMKTGLARRIGMYILYLFSRTPQRLLVGILLTSALLSLIMPEHAVAAMLFPILLDISHRLDGKDSRRYSAWLFLSMAWGAVVGGIGTPLGGARAPLAMGMLEEEFGIKMSFLQWTKFALPASLLGITAAILWLLWGTRKIKEINIGEVRDEARGEIAKGHSLTIDERKISIIFGLALVSWIFFSKKIDMAVTAIIASSLLFVLRVLLWKEVEEYVNWGVILMYGGAIALGSSLVESGAAKWLTLHFLSPFVKDPTLFLIVSVTIAIFLTEWISNVATVALLLPIAFGVAHASGYNPIFITLLITIPSGLAFSFPMGTPPNAIAYSSGKYPIRFAFFNGARLSLTMIVLLVLLFKFVWPTLGVVLK